MPEDHEGLLLILGQASRLQEKKRYQNNCVFSPCLPLIGLPLLTDGYRIGGTNLQINYYYYYYMGLVGSIFVFRSHVLLIVLVFQAKHSLLTTFVVVSYGLRVFFQAIFFIIFKKLEITCTLLLTLLSLVGCLIFFCLRRFKITCTRVFVSGLFITWIAFVHALFLCLFLFIGEIVQEHVFLLPLFAFAFNAL